MRLPGPTLIAQYPEDQEPALDVRKEITPAILPQVIFIRFRILVASVAGEDWGKLRFAVEEFLIGDNGRGGGLASRRRFDWDSDSSGGEGIIDGKPIEEVSSTKSLAVVACNEPTRCRCFKGNGGDLSRKRSSRVRVLGRWWATFRSAMEGTSTSEPGFGVTSLVWGVVSDV